ncbi:glycosyltransferase 48kDa subunit family protein [Striga asiatica]|uniref:Glycosyltransferase 48kDa subunit family protein n=1 Tax=Striga asiatica TaxID=4170 RepID=A0A5A7P5G3_STRAF|nr:glycosyltransferase 48kDa subunit family protein [Striga asiatica]
MSTFDLKRPINISENLELTRIGPGPGSGSQIRPSELEFSGVRTPLVTRTGRNLMVSGSLNRITDRVLRRHAMGPADLRRVGNEKSHRQDCGALEVGFHAVHVLGFFAEQGYGCGASFGA